jgi:hypothetical protein
MSAVMAAAAITASNVATNKDLVATNKVMAIGPPTRRVNWYHLIRAHSHDKRYAPWEILEGVAFWQSYARCVSAELLPAS